MDTIGGDSGCTRNAHFFFANFKMLVSVLLLRWKGAVISGNLGAH